MYPGSVKRLKRNSHGKTIVCMSLKEKIKEAALETGFAFATFVPLTVPPYADLFDQWLAEGKAGEMDWMARYSDKRKDPSLLLHEAKSFLLLGMNHYQPPPPEKLMADPSRGRIAMYAWGKDYHKLMWKRQKQLMRIIRDISPKPVAGRWHVDSAPILEKLHGLALNTGFLGRNSLLIHPSLGSRFFLGDMLLTLEVEPDEAEPELAGCGKCKACPKVCPTGALNTHYVNDSPRCISYLTIEHKSSIPRELRPLMKNWVFGCDDCQDYCPYNRKQKQPTSEEWFKQVDRDKIAPPLLKLMMMNREEYDLFFQGRAVRRASLSRMKRNTAVAIGNWGNDEALLVLKASLCDADPMVREHVIWALGQIPGRTSRKVIEDHHRIESDPLVLSEISIILDS